MLNANEKLKKPLEALPLLPELEFIFGTCKSCEFQVVKFNDEIQYYTDKAGNVTDKPKKEFYIVVELKDHQLPNGSPRNQWIRLGASFGEKSLLPKVLASLSFENNDPTADDICRFFTNRSIKFQLANKVGEDKKVRQKVMVETIRNAPAAVVAKPKGIQTPPKQEIAIEDVVWEE